MCRLSWNPGTSTSWNPQGLSRPVMRLLYQGKWQLLCLCTGLSDCTLVCKNSINWSALKTLSIKTVVAQGLNNKLNTYQQKYNTICEAGTTLVLFNVQSHPHILYGNWYLDTCRFCEAYFVSNKYFIFTLMTIRVLVTEHKGHIFMFILSIPINFKFCCLLCVVCDLYCFSVRILLFLAFCVQVQGPVPPDGNPTAVNKYCSILYIKCQWGQQGVMSNRMYKLDIKRSSNSQQQYFPESYNFKFEVY